MKRSSSAMTFLSILLGLQLAVPGVSVLFFAQAGAEGAQANDIAVQMFGPPQIHRGDTIRYQVRVQNAGGATATGITLYDAMPANTAFNPGLTDSPCALQGDTVVCPNIVLAPGDTKIFMIAFTVSSALACQGATIQNQATVSASGDINSANNQSSVTTAVTCPTASSSSSSVSSTSSSSSSISSSSSSSSTTSSSSSSSSSTPSPTDVTITKSGPPQIHRGDTIRYAVMAHNVGTTQVTDAMITDAVPANTTFNQALTDAPCALQGMNVVCPGIVLAPGDAKIYMIAFTVSPTTACQGVTIQNHASVSATGDTNTGNNQSGTVTTVVTCPPGSSSSSSISSSSSSSVSSSSSISSSSSSSVSSSSSSSSSVAATDVTITKSGPPQINRGDTIRYMLTVRNAGATQVNDAMITDAVPANTTFNQALTDAPCTLNGSAVTCSGIALAPGDTKIFMIAFTVSPTLACQGVTIQNQASVSASGDMTPANNQSAMTSTMVTCP